MMVAVVVKSLCLSKHHTMKTGAGVEVQIHEFLTLALDQGVVSFAPRPSVPIEEKAGWYPDPV